MIANQLNAEHLRKRGYSADSIAVNMGITRRQLEQIEAAPVVPAPIVQKLTAPRHGFLRARGELV